MKLLLKFCHGKKLSQGVTKEKLWKCLGSSGHWIYITISWHGTDMVTLSDIVRTPLSLPMAAILILVSRVETPAKQFVWDTDVLSEGQHETILLFCV